MLKIVQLSLVGTAFAQSVQEGDVDKVVHEEGEIAEESTADEEHGHGHMHDNGEMHYGDHGEGHDEPMMDMSRVDPDYELTNEMFLKMDATEFWEEALPKLDPSKLQDLIGTLDQEHLQKMLEGMPQPEGGDDHGHGHGDDHGHGHMHANGEMHYGDHGDAADAGEQAEHTEL